MCGWNVVSLAAERKAIHYQRLTQEFGYSPVWDISDDVSGVKSVMLVVSNQLNSVNQPVHDVSSVKRKAEISAVKDCSTF